MADEKLQIPIETEIDSALADLKALEQSLASLDKRLGGLRPDLEGVGKGIDNAGNKAGKGAGLIGRFTASLSGISPVARSSLSTLRLLTVGIGSVNLASIAAGFGLGKLILNTATLGDELAKISKRTGAGVEFLSELKFAADLSDVSIGELESGIRFLNRALAEVKTGNLSEAGKTLTAFAETFEIDLARPLEEIFPQIAEGFKQIEDSALKTELAMQIFGRGGAALIPLLDEGEEGLRRLGQQAESAGQVFDEQLALASERLNDDITTLTRSVGGLAIGVGEQFIPVLDGLVVDLTLWVQQNDELIQQDVAGFLANVFSIMSDLAPLVGFTAGAVAELTGEFSRLVNSVKVGDLRGLRDFILSGSAFSLVFDDLASSSEKAAGRQRELNNFVEEYAARQGIATGEAGAWAEITVKNAEVQEEAGKATGKSADAVKKLEEFIRRLSATQGESRTATQGVRDAQEELTKSVAASGSVFSALERDLARAGERIIRQNERLSEIELRFLPETEQIRAEADELIRELEQLGRERTELAVRVQGAIAEVEEDASRKTALVVREQGIEALRASGGFVDGIKAEFLEFSESVRSNSELASEFFANTLSEMSQNASDLLFNVLTGKFDNLVDVAKNAFRSILRSFIDLVSAIITKQIVINLVPNLHVSGALGSIGQLGQGGGFLSGIGNVLGKIPGLGRFFGGSSTVGGVIQRPLDAAASGGGLLGGLSPFLPAIGAGAFGLFNLFGGDIGAGIGGLAGGGLSAGLSAGLFGALGGLAGPLAPLVAIAGPLIGGLIGKLFKKSPRLDIDIGAVQETVNGQLRLRAATVQEVIRAVDSPLSLFAETLVQISDKGQSVDKQKIRDTVLKSLDGVIGSVTGLIDQLPSDIAERLSTAFRRTTLDVKDFRPGFHLLELDVKTQIDEFFQKFVGGELPAQFLFSARSFFEKKFLPTLGVSQGAASQFISSRFDEFSKAPSQEARIALGEKFLAELQTFTDAFNIIAGNFGDPLRDVLALSERLNFRGIPTIDQLTLSLEAMLKRAKISPEVLADYTQLRQLIIDTQLRIAQSVSGLVNFTDDLARNLAIVGGTAGVSNEALDASIESLLRLAKQEGLSAEEREVVLRELAGLTDQRLQRELQLQRTTTEGLENQIRIAREFRDLSASIEGDIRSLFAGPNSILNPVEQLNFIQGEIVRARLTLKTATTGAGRLEAAGNLRGLSNRLIDLGAGAFQTGSPEFQAIFRQVADELQGLLDVSVAEGSALEGLEDRLVNLGNQQVELTGEVADRIRGLLEFIRDETNEILSTRLDAIATLLGGAANIPGVRVPTEPKVGAKGTVGRVGIFPIGKPSSINGEERVGLLPGFNTGSQTLTSRTTKPSDSTLTLKIILENNTPSDAAGRVLAREIPKTLSDWFRYGAGRDIIRRAVSQ